MAASPAHVFAMKARAARTRDIDDLRLLAGIIGVDSADAAVRICATSTLTNPYPRDQPPCFRSFSADDSETLHRVLKRYRARVQRSGQHRPRVRGRGPGVFPAGDQLRRGGQGLGQPVPGRAQRHLQPPVPDCGLDRTSSDQRAKSGSRMAPGPSVAAPRRAPVRNSKATRTIPLAQTAEKEDRD